MATLAEAVTTKRARIESVDLLRGVVMIIMALDHTRDFFGIPGQNPTDLTTASTGLFLTRWITHFCAPVFFLLTGTGASLSLGQKTRGELSRFLFKRGLWLIFLEVVVLRCFAYQFNVDYRTTMLIVLWALGWAMIVLSFLVRLPVPVVATVGAVMIAGHNLLDSVESIRPIWIVLHSRGFVWSRAGHVVFGVYPLIPWVGVTAMGYALGRVYSWEPDRRRAFLLRVGVGMVLAFVALRAANVYGDPTPWTEQPTFARTVLSFLNTNKYPPSLLFLLMTLGPAVLLLRAVDGGAPRALRVVAIIGKVPLFYYVLHFALIHWLAVAVCYARNGSAHWMFESPDIAHFPFTAPPVWGLPLPAIYLLWALVVAAMIPPSTWFAALKQRRTDAWLSYL
jgi:uncharacterized membrane protein